MQDAQTLQQMEQLLDTDISLAEQLNFKKGFKGLKQFYASLDLNTSRLANKIQKLENLLVTINKLNVTNAKTIALSYNQLTNVIDFMFGKDKSNNCYTKDAKITNHADSSRLSKA